MKKDGRIRIVGKAPVLLIQFIQNGHRLAGDQPVDTENMAPGARASTRKLPESLQPVLLART